VLKVDTGLVAEVIGRAVDDHAGCAVALNLGRVPTAVATLLPLEAMTKQLGVFISYRRADTQGDALRLHELISAGMPEAQVFIDVMSIGAGQFEQVIDETIAQSQVALVLIGPNWLNERLNDPRDLHVREIETALAAGLEMIPVLLHRPDMPTEDRLPAAIRALHRWNAVPIDDRHWRPDADALVAMIRKIVGLAPPTGTESPTVSPTPASEETPPNKFNYFDIEKFHQKVIDVGSELYCVGFSPDQSAIAAGSGDVVFVWPLGAAVESDTALTLPHTDSRFVYSLAFTSDGKTLVTGSEDGGVRFWDWRNKEQIKEDLHTHNSQAVYAVAVSRNGSYLATGDSNGLVQLWNLSGYTRRTKNNFPGGVSSLAFSRKGNILAVGTHNDELYLWDVNTKERDRLGKHESSVESLAFSPDGSQVASCGLDKYVRLWNVESRKPMWEGTRGKQHEYLVKSVAFSPDGKVIVSAGWDKTVWLWNVAGQQTQTIPWWGEDSDFKWHTDWIWAASFSPDGDMLASAGSDGKLILWTIPSLNG
jgi:WD40 repeat protein